MSKKLSGAFEGFNVHNTLFQCFGICNIPTLQKVFLAFGTSMSIIANSPENLNYHHESLGQCPKQMHNANIPAFGCWQMCAVSSDCWRRNN